MTTRSRKYFKKVSIPSFLFACHFLKNSFSDFKKILAVLLIWRSTISFLILSLYLPVVFKRGSIAHGWHGGSSKTDLKPFVLACAASANKNCCLVPHSLIDLRLFLCLIPMSFWHEIRSLIFPYYYLLLEKKFFFLKHKKNTTTTKRHESCGLATLKPLSRLHATTFFCL